MLSYTGGRKVDSGPLAVKPLAEAQVAEYRFRQACGRHACPLGAVGPMKESWRRGEDCLDDDTSNESEGRTGSGWFTLSYSSCLNTLGLLFWKSHWEWIGEAAGCIGAVLGGLVGMGIANAEVLRLV